MKLNEPIQDSFELNGHHYDVDCSFDLVLDVFEMFDNEVMNNLEKMRTAVLMMTDEALDNPEDIVAVWDYIDEHFLRIKKKRVVYDLHGNPMPVAKDEDEDVRLIDFEVDAQEIYASFVQAYNINLFEAQGRLTWPEFIALLNGMPEGTAVSQLVEIRSWKPSKHDSSEYKAKMRRLQNKYRLDGKEGDE